MNRNGNKLTPADVALILAELDRIAELEAQIPLRKIELAKRFNVSQSTLTKIRNGTTWGWLREQK
jgi:transcriptional regulator with XRE-family HTH domain